MIAMTTSSSISVNPFRLVSKSFVMTLPRQENCESEEDCTKMSQK